MEPEQSEKLILEAAAKINEAGGKLVTDKKHKDPFNALVGIWCYWNVYSHLAERSAPLLKRERNVAVLKALNNLFKMLKDKVGMSNDKFALGSRSFPFIDQVCSLCCLDLYCTASKLLDTAVLSACKAVWLYGIISLPICVVIKTETWRE